MHEQFLNTDVNTLTPLPSFEMDWQKNIPYLFGSLGIVIEFLAGDVREKVKDGGRTVAGVMPVAYGFILGTTDAHGEEIDMYLASMPDPNATIYVIDQVNPGDGIFDEHKVMLGFGSEDEVVHIYKSVFADGSGEKRLGQVVTFTPESFQAWMSTEGYSLKPAGDTGIDTADNVTVYAGVKFSGFSPKDMPKPRDEAGGVIVQLEDLSRGPKIKTLVCEDGLYNHHLYFYSGLDIENWSNTVDTLCRLLDLATNKDVVHIHIASPGGSVMLMGRIVSAMKRTVAKVITYAEGCVASAATAVWAAGHERHILPGSYFMQHMSSQLLMGKTTNIRAKSIFGVDYIENQLKELIEIGLFNEDEILGMSEGSFDIFISGREAISRVGKISARAPSL